MKQIIIITCLLAVVSCANEGEANNKHTKRGLISDSSRNQQQGQISSILLDKSRSSLENSQSSYAGEIYLSSQESGQSGYGTNPYQSFSLRDNQSSGGSGSYQTLLQSDSQLGLGRGSLQRGGATVSITSHRVPYLVPQPYPVPVTRHVPFPIPQPVEIPVPRPVKVSVPIPKPVIIPRPVPVTVTKQVPYPVNVPIRVPVPQPYPVQVPQQVPVTVPQPVPVRVQQTLVVPVPQPISVGNGGLGGSGSGLDYGIREGQISEQQYLGLQQNSGIENLFQLSGINSEGYEKLSEYSSISSGTNSGSNRDSDLNTKSFQLSGISNGNYKNSLRPELSRIYSGNSGSFGLGNDKSLSLSQISSGTSLGKKQLIRLSGRPLGSGSFSGASLEDEKSVDLSSVSSGIFSGDYGSSLESGKLIQLSQGLGENNGDSLNRGKAIDLSGNLYRDSSVNSQAYQFSTISIPGYGGLLEGNEKSIQSFNNLARGLDSGSGKPIGLSEISAGNVLTSSNNIGKYSTLSGPDSSSYAGSQSSGSSGSSIKLNTISSGNSKY